MSKKSKSLKQSAIFQSPKEQDNKIKYKLRSKVKESILKLKEVKVLAKFWIQWQRIKRFKLALKRKKKLIYFSLVRALKKNFSIIRLGRQRNLPLLKSIPASNSLFKLVRGKRLYFKEVGYEETSIFLENKYYEENNLETFRKCGNIYMLLKIVYRRKRSFLKKTSNFQKRRRLRQKFDSGIEALKTVGTRLVDDIRGSRCLKGFQRLGIKSPTFLLKGAVYPTLRKNTLKIRPDVIVQNLKKSPIPRVVVAGKRKLITCKYSLKRDDAIMRLNIKKYYSPKQIRRRVVKNLINFLSNSFPRKIKVRKKLNFFKKIKNRARYYRVKRSLGQISLLHFFRKMSKLKKTKLVRINSKRIGNQPTQIKLNLRIKTRRNMNIRARFTSLKINRVQLLKKISATSYSKKKKGPFC